MSVFTLILLYSCIVSNSPISMMTLFDKKQSFMMAALLKVTLSDLASINYSLHGCTMNHFDSQPKHS